MQKLTQLRTGGSAIVLGVESNECATLSQLLAHGIQTNAHVSLVRKKPAYIVDVGGVTVALDHNVANSIIIGAATSI